MIISYYHLSHEIDTKNTNKKQQKPNTTFFNRLYENIMKNKKKNYLFCLKNFVSCSSADEGDSNIDPTHKAIREKERRQANNVRERYVMNTINY